MHLAAIAMGSNLASEFGDREANLQKAVERVRALGEVRAVSSFHDTEPVGYVEQPRFLNGALLLAYLNDGGLGVLIGDGKLPDPGWEHILETYYSIGVLKGCAVSFDYQFVENPGYNSDRGPANIFAIRLHAEF